MDKFYIDAYLYNLSKDIKLDKDISKFYLDYDNSKIKVKNLKKELTFFDQVNMSLSDVCVRYRGKTSFISPKNIAIFLGSEYPEEIRNLLEDKDKYSNISHLFRTKVSYGPGSDFINYVNQYIFINTNRGYPAKIAYLHEITHTQTGPNINVINDYNLESLPIFIELIYGYYNDINILFRRLKDLSIDIDFYMKTTDEELRNKAKKYIISILKAINLYSLYIDNNNTKKEITSDINKVFEYEKTLEDLFDRYQVSFKDFKPSLKTLIKLNN